MKDCLNCAYCLWDGKEERCLRTLKIKEGKERYRLCELERAEYFPLLGKLFRICGCEAKFYKEINGGN